MPLRLILTLFAIKIWSFKVRRNNRVKNILILEIETMKPILVIGKIKVFFNFLRKIILVNLVIMKFI